MKKLIMLIVLCIMITGCSTTKTQETMKEIDETPTIEETPAIEETKELADDSDIETVEEMPSLEDVEVTIPEEKGQINPLTIENSTLENTFNEGNVVLAHVKIDYPVIQNTMEEEGLVKINQFFSESAQALFEENNTYASDNVEFMKEAAIADNNSKDYYSEYKVTYEVTYNKNGYLSILENFSEDNYGMQNPNAYSTGYLFDIHTGELLTINAVLKGTDEEVASIIGQAFLDSDIIPEDVKANYSEEIVANTKYIEFYLDDTNINFFYNPNMVAPYSAGTLKVQLPLNTQDLIKIDFISLSE